MRTARLDLVLLALLAVPACAADGLTSPMSEAPGSLDPSAVASTPGVPTKETPAAPITEPGERPQPAALCLQDGDFDFRVSSAGLAAWEGHLVTAAALENGAPAGNAQVQRRPVRLSATITDGRFTIACPSSLRETYYYPSYALYLDADKDGHCGPGDLGFVMQLYGWDQAVDQELGVGWLDWAVFMPVADLHPPIGGTAGSFCADYFP